MYGACEHKQGVMHVWVDILMSRHLHEPTSSWTYQFIVAQEVQQAVRVHPVPLHPPPVLPVDSAQAMTAASDGQCQVDTMLYIQSVVYATQTSLVCPYYSLITWLYNYCTTMLTIAAILTTRYDTVWLLWLVWQIYSCCGERILRVLIHVLQSCCCYLQQFRFPCPLLSLRTHV